MGYHSETTRNIEDTFNELHKSIDAILSTLQGMKGNFTQISATLASTNVELNSFKTSIHAIVNSLTIITPIIYFACIFFTTQGLALVSIYLNNRSER